MAYNTIEIVIFIPQQSFVNERINKTHFVFSKQTVSLVSNADGHN